jgi:Na+/H+ antiporter NhaD/arsenite permease-like protein
MSAKISIAGNIFLLGAASNIIILQNAERRGNKEFSVVEFSKVGIPLTIMNILVYLMFI